MSEDPCCKVVRVARDADLEAYTETLGSEWERMDGRGIRALTTAFHKRVLRHKLLPVGIIPLDGELESLCDALNSDSSGEAVEGPRAEDKLREYGLDPESVDDDLLSYRTLHRHFTECEGRSASTSIIETEQASERGQGYIFSARERTRRITERTLERLRAADQIPLNEFAVDVRIELKCQNCGARTRAESAVFDGCSECSGGSTETPDSEVGPKQ